MTALLVVVSGALGAVIWYVGMAQVGQIRELRETWHGIRDVLEGLSDGPERVFRDRFNDLEDIVERLPKKWEDIKREAAAAESRARYHVGRAREELEERGLTHPGLEDMADQLQLIDGGGGPGEGVQPMRSEVESVPRQDQRSHDPDDGDWERAALTRKFGGK